MPVHDKIVSTIDGLLGLRKTQRGFGNLMWAMFSNLRYPKTNHRVDRIFRIVGYGTILVLLCFADAFFEPPVDGAATRYNYRYGLPAHRAALTTFCTRGFSGLVASTAALVATGWSEPFPGRV